MQSRLVARSKTRLLVSVRDAAEARAALAGGADVIDVKEPAAGALGAASSTVLREVLRTVASRVPVSAALGELAAWNPDCLTNFPPGVAYAKLGLAGMAGRNDWPAVWQSALASLPPATGRVAVVYADGLSAAAPPVEHILAHGARFGCAAVLVDTFDKTRGDLLAHFSLDQLARLIAAVHRQNLPIVLAGSLRQSTLARILPLAPDVVAVRTAACSGGRRGRVTADRVAALAKRLAPRAKNFPTAGRATLNKFDKPA